MAAYVIVQIKVTCGASFQPVNLTNLSPSVTLASLQRR